MYVFGTKTSTELLNINGNTDITGQLKIFKANDGEQIILDGDQSFIRFKQNGEERGYIGYRFATNNHLYINNPTNEIWTIAQNSVVLKSNTGEYF